jgi:5-methylthioadenosine/S-adenosylhomocysteine deaminase
MCNFCRRNFIRGAAAFGAASLFTAPRLANAQLVTAGLPARGEFVIRNGHVMTMDNALGDIAGGVVHVRDGEIIAVGREVSAPGA